MICGHPVGLEQHDVIHLLPTAPTVEPTEKHTEYCSASCLCVAGEVGGGLGHHLALLQREQVGATAAGGSRASNGPNNRSTTTQDSIPLTTTEFELYFSAAPATEGCGLCRGGSRARPRNHRVRGARQSAEERFGAVLLLPPCRVE